MPATLGVVGAESALLRLLRSRSTSSESTHLAFLVTSDPTDPGILAARGLTLVDSIPELATRADVILVAAEPGDTFPALESLAPFLSEDHLVLVSSEQVTLDRLRLALGPGPALVKLALDANSVEEGIVVASAEAGTAPGTVARATEAFAGVAILELVPEDSLEVARAVLSASKACLATALAGMEDGAVEAGLPRDMAKSFVRQTATATALLLQNHPGSPADLKDQVASPGGTTIAGLALLEDRGVRGVFMRAVEAAALQVNKGRDADPSHVVE